jgi:hypothetical protein
MPRPWLAAGSRRGYGNHDGASRSKCLAFWFLESLLREPGGLQAC